MLRILWSWTYDLNENADMWQNKSGPNVTVGVKISDEWIGLVWGWAKSQPRGGGWGDRMRIITAFITMILFISGKLIKQLN